MVLRASQLAARSGSPSERYASRLELLPLGQINVLEQVRKTYEDIEKLAEDIADKGLMHPIQVAILTAGAANRYLDLINRLWRKRYNLSKLTKLAGERRYAILITGHRRLQAASMLDLNLIESKCYDQIDPVDAMAMQCSENIHRSVPAHEQADAYDRMFSLLRSLDESLTVAEFARRFGCDPDTVRRARRYCRLPDEIRCEVELGRLGYGSALELGRLSERLEYSAQTIDAWRLRIVEGNLTVAAVKKAVDSEIARAFAGVRGLWDGRELDRLDIKHRRRVFERKTIDALHTYRRYLERVKPLIESGVIGPQGEYLDTSTRQVVVDAALALEAILPDLRQRLSEAQLKQAEAVLTEVDQLIAAIDELES